MNKGLITEFYEKIKPENKNFVSKNLEISDQIYSILKEKGWTQKRLAKEMDKKESEISKFLSGLHNLTLKTITKIETILDEDIILTATKAKQQYQDIVYQPLSSQNIKTVSGEALTNKLDELKKLVSDDGDWEKGGNKKVKAA